MKVYQKEDSIKGTKLDNCNEYNAINYFDTPDDIDILLNTSRLETEIYDDEYITITNMSLVIKRTTFPFLKEETIPLSTIKSIELEDLHFWSGQYRLWGLHFCCVWFHLDNDRFMKNKYIKIKTHGSFIKIGITPTKIDIVYEILLEHIKK